MYIHLVICLCSYPHPIVCFMHMCFMCVHVVGGHVVRVCAFHHIFWGRVFDWTWNLHFPHNGWPVSSGDPSAPLTPAPGIQKKFAMLVWGHKLGFLCPWHSCFTLLIKPCHQGHLDSFEVGSSTRPEFSDEAELSGQQNSGSLSSLAPQHWGYKLELPQVAVFCGILRLCVDFV